MDEARRFLRYVTPGLSFVALTILLLWMLVPDWTRNRMADLRGDAGIGVVIATLLGSGGIGFFFSVLHHSLHWRTGPVDHRGLIARLRTRKVLYLVDAQTDKVFPIERNPTRFEAWSIVAALWHERVAKNNKIKGAEPRASSLADLVHSTGTARVAAASAWLLAFAIPCSIDSLSFGWVRFLSTNGIAFGLLCVHHVAYYRTGLAAQRVVEQILDDALVDEYRTSCGPVQTRVILTDG